jgi:hypothetical protein
MRSARSILFLPYFAAAGGNCDQPVSALLLLIFQPGDAAVELTSITATAGSAFDRREKDYGAKSQQIDKASIKQTGYGTVAELLNDCGLN